MVIKDMSHTWLGYCSFPKNREHSTDLEKSAKKIIQPKVAFD